MLNPKESLVKMWMSRLISSEDLEKEMDYHKKMAHEYSMSQK